MKKFVAPVLACLFTFLSALVQPIHASPIATIDGVYDLNSSIPSQYDTPSLIFHNTSGYTFINAQMVLTGYQGINNGVTKTVSLPNMAAGDTTISWSDGFPASVGPPGDLFAYDYDDEYGTSSIHVGNFSVTFTATLSGVGPLNGQPIFSVFSPTTNFTGGFVGWEGLDQNGFNETAFDDHNGTVSGTLAVIDIGLPPGTPEPTSIAIFGLLGIAGGYYGWRRKTAA